MGWGWGWRPYVPVAQRRAQAAAEVARLRKKGVDIQPVEIKGRQIALTFWGRAWCEHLEKFSDFDNRLPRGRTYVCNGSVCHLGIRKGRIEAKVSGSSLYDVQIAIKTLPARKWKDLKQRCAGQVGSLLELLQGRLSSQVMGIVTDRDEGLLPLPKEMSFECSCPDWAYMCKHVAAVLYGVGARLDSTPELLFLLRGVDHRQMVSEGAARGVLTRGPAAKDRVLSQESLSDVFGIDLAGGQAKPAPAPAKPKPRTKRSAAAPSRAKSKKRAKASGAKAAPAKKAARKPSARARRRMKKTP